MAEKVPQTYANHARYDPSFHFSLVPVAAITFLLTIWNLIRNFGFPAVLLTLVSLVALVSVFKFRLYSLKVQDRVIRLEERLRLSMLLSEPLRSRISELTEGQLIALRFASDAEIPVLVEKALAGKLRAGEIKQAIVSWRPDYFRV
jgi:hypothetical protein